MNPRATPSPRLRGEHLFGRYSSGLTDLASNHEKYLREVCVPSIAVDAGPLVALFDGSDKYHAEAIAFVQRTGLSLVTNLLVLAEVAALLPMRFQLDLLRWTEGGVEIDWGRWRTFRALSSS